MRKKFIFHCGFPKCASTSLQYSFNNSEVNFLGFNPSYKNKKFYKNHELSFFFEQVIRFGNNINFQKTKDKISNYLVAAYEGTNKNTILSNENIIGRFLPYDLPNEIKIERLCMILPTSSSILIAIRDIPSLLFSYFNLYISNGYCENIDYFFDEVKMLDEAFSFSGSLLLSSVVEQIKLLRPDIEVIIIDIDNKHSYDQILHYLEVNSINERKNRSIAYSDLERHLELNRKSFGGKNFLDWFEIHRVFPKATVNDKLKFKLSRYRHKHEEIVESDFNSGKIKKEFIEKIPSVFKKISKKNYQFYKSCSYIRK